MKKLYTLLLALVATLGLNAQTFAVNDTANWQQYIPTILGGNCVQLSNVTYNAGPGTAGLFYNFPNFGDGILITTGSAVFAAGPNANGSDGSANNLPGDPMLDQLIPGYTSFDATALEFDFVATTTGTVTVDYIFASEEYPEFVGSSYNDVFAFYVSEANFPNQVQNIALIPGTPIPVAINNLNPGAYSQFYVDNTGGQDIGYDGYTTPLQATFNVQAGVTYHLKIAIADAGDMIFDSGVFLKTFAVVTQSLYGNVTHQGNPAQGGVAELFGFNTDSTSAPLIATVPIVNGTYNFDNIQSGAYNIRVTLDTALYPGTYPTYYDSAFVWNDAQIVSLPCANYSVDMGLLVLDPGTGVIVGTVGEGEVQKANNNQTSIPVVGAHVLLVGLNDNLVYGFTKTNAAGQYTFTSVPNGSYKVVVDMPGIYQTQVHNATITDELKLVDNLHYLVTPTKIVITNSGVGVAENTALSTLGLYPNPVGNSLNLSLGVKEQTTLTATITNLTGQTLATVYNGNVSAGIQTIAVNTQSLSNGVYFMNINANGFSKTIRFVKQ